MIAITMSLILGFCVVTAQSLRREPLNKVVERVEQPRQSSDASQTGKIPAKSEPGREIGSQPPPPPAPDAPGDRQGNPATEQAGRPPPKQEAAETLGLPEQEPADPEPVEVTLHPSRFQKGQVGAFQTGKAGSAQHATVLAVLSKSTVLVRSLGEDFVLSGVHTDNLARDKAVFLRGKWEVIDLIEFGSKHFHELAHLTDASEVAKQAEGDGEKPTPRGMTKAPLPSGDVLAPIVPTPAQIKEKSRGGPVQVRGYYRANGTYVRPHTRSAPGGRR